MNRYFPSGDAFWTDALEFLRRYATPEDHVLAPKEFLEELPSAYGYGIQYAFPLAFFTLVVLHKGMYEYLPRDRLLALHDTYHPVFANAVFVIVSSRPRVDMPQGADEHCRAWRLAMADLRRAEADDAREPVRPGTAALVTTRARPDALARTLPQLQRAGAPILVVDDASHEDVAARNRAIARACGARYLRFPDHRGLPAAINVGIEYWLADPDVTWISYFQDDVDAHPEIYARLAKVQDPDAWPILTGRLSTRHPDYGRQTIGGEEIVLMRGISGQHIHAHRDYWKRILPVPSPYLGAPRHGGDLAGQGPEEDFWISAWSPASVTKQGGHVACLPGLVRAFLHSAEDSTWGRALGEVDMPIAGSASGLDLQAAGIGHDSNHAADWTEIPWIREYAGHFNLAVQDVKPVFEVFFGDRAEDWEHPFGALSEWTRHWYGEEAISARQAIIQEHGWTWESVGAKVLQNEIYRRDPGDVKTQLELRGVVAKHAHQLGRPVDLLDYGCGTGNFIEYLREIPRLRCELWEIDPVLVDYCAAKFKALPQVHCKRIPTRSAWTGEPCRVETQLVEFGRSFDVIHVMDVIEHTLDPLAILMNLSRHLNPNGLLLFNYPDYIEGDWHTPEANILRPFCLLYVNLMYTQEHAFVYRKTGSMRTEIWLNRLARLFNGVARRYARRRAIAYLKNTPYAEKYRLG